MSCKIETWYHLVGPSSEIVKTAEITTIMQQTNKTEQKQRNLKLNF